MGFDVSYVVDILKFPWPLYPKNKNPFPFGLRFDIPALIQDNEFIIELPAGNNFELLAVTFSSTGYKDGDCYSVVLNNEYVLKNIYTKELGQVKEIRPVKEIKQAQDSLKLVFHNNTGTSKVIWVDFDMTAVTPVLYSTGNPLLMEDIPEQVKVALPYIKDGEYPELQEVDTTYWADDLKFGGRVVRKPFWEGRNDILHVYSMYQSKVKTDDPYRGFIYQLSKDAKAGVNHDSFNKPWDEFVLGFNHLIDDSFSPRQLAEIYLTYILKTPVTIFDSCIDIINGNKIDMLVSFVKLNLTFVFDWIDFNEVNPDSRVLGFELDSYSVYNDDKLRYDNKIKSFISIEPSSLNQEKITSRMIKPKDYFHLENAETVMDVEYLPMDNSEYQVILKIQDTAINFVETFIHEMGHAIDGYRRDKLGLRFSQEAEWLKISGWDRKYFEKYTYKNYPFLIVPKFRSELVGMEPPVTPYGCTNPLEDFAESFAMYCINPLCLQVYYPKRWKFFEENIKNMIQ